MIFIFYTKLPCPASFMLTSILPPIVQMKTQARRTEERRWGPQQGAPSLLRAAIPRVAPGLALLLSYLLHILTLYTLCQALGAGKSHLLQSLAVHLSQTAKTWTITRRLPALGLGTWQSRL